MSNLPQSVGKPTGLQDKKSFIVPIIVMALGIAAIGYAIYLKHSGTPFVATDRES